MITPTRPVEAPAPSDAGRRSPGVVPAATGTGASAAPGGRHPRLRAAAVSTVCGVVGAPAFLVWLGWLLEEHGEPQRPGLFFLLMASDVALGLAASVLVGLAGRSRTLALALVATAMVSVLAAPAGVVGAVRLGARRSWRLDALVVAVVVGGSLGYARVLELATGPEQDPLPLLVEVLGLAAGAALLLLWGRVRATRAALVTSLRQQAAAAERERAATTHGREADVARTRAEERSAIARDMHDTLSHQLALIAVHAGALATRDDLPPERAREAARTVRDAAAEANAVLREVLTALRSTDPAQRLGHHGGAEPLPTSASVDALVARAREQGQEVRLDWRGLDARALDERSPATAVSLAQVVAELLVNAGRHAPGAPVDVVLAHEEEDLVLRASNPLVPAAPAAPGTGLGLVGVEERARLLRGSARYGAAGGRFDVEVRVPWTA